MKALDASQEAVVHALLARWSQDADRGRVQAISDYAAMFPGHEELVLAELQALQANDGHDPDTAPPAGAAAELRIGAYHVRRELGRGGQAIVYLAEDTRLSRNVALKVLPRAPATLTQELRLQREAATAAKLDDSGICPIYEVGRDGEHLFLAMKYVAGQSLAAVLQAQRQRFDRGEAATAVLPPVAATLLLFERLLRSLQRAHDAGVVHRDLKPANIMVSSDGTPVLLDFGLAIDAGTEDAPLTRTGDVFGTPHYLSPERLTHRTRGDHGDDLWAVAVSLFETLTLQRPFQGPTVDLLYQAILRDEPARAQKLRPGLPRDLETVLQTALAKDRRRRYRTAADFAADLGAVRSHAPIRARAPGPLRRIAFWHRRHPALATGAWLLLAGLGSTIAVQQTSLRQTRAAEQETKHLADFLLHKLLGRASPNESRGRTITVNEVFDEAEASIASSFPEPSRSSGALWHALGLTNKGLARFPKARACFEQAVAARSRVLGVDDPLTLDSQRELAQVLIAANELGAARSILQDLQAAEGRAWPVDDPRSLLTGLAAARLAFAEGEFARTEELLRPWIARQEAAEGGKGRSTLLGMGLLARSLERRGKRAEAEPLLREVLELERRLLGEDHPTALETMNTLASLLHDRWLFDGENDQQAEAEATYAECMAWTERVHGKQSHPYATLLNNCASFQQDVGKRRGDPAAQRRAVAMFRESLALRAAIDGRESVRYANALGNLGGALLAVGDVEAGCETLAEALTRREALHGPFDIATIQALHNVMRAQSTCGDHATAMRTLAEFDRRLPQAKGLQPKVGVTFEFGALLSLLDQGEVATIRQRGAAAWESAIVAWPPDGGATAKRIAEIVAQAAKHAGDLDDAAVWRARAGAALP
jgi:serine/threonine protein kinase/tetratricopeptide (TPR) repeat protein